MAMATAEVFNRRPEVPVEMEVLEGEVVVEVGDVAS